MLRNILTIHVPGWEGLGQTDSSGQQARPYDPASYSQLPTLAEGDAPHKQAQGPPQGPPQNGRVAASPTSPVPSEESSSSSQRNGAGTRGLTQQERLEARHREYRAKIGYDHQAESYDQKQSVDVPKSKKSSPEKSKSSTPPQQSASASAPSAADTAQLRQHVGSPGADTSLSNGNGDVMSLRDALQALTQHDQAVRACMHAYFHPLSPHVHA